MQPNAPKETRYGRIPEFMSSTPGEQTKAGIMFEMHCSLCLEGNPDREQAFELKPTTPTEAFRAHLKDYHNVEIIED